MAIGVIATLKIKDGMQEGFEELVREMMAAVRANEPGNTLYRFCRSKSDPATYIAMEIYDDEAALEAHRTSEHYRSIGAKLGPSLAGRPEIQFFETV